MQTVVNGVLTNYELINPKAGIPLVVLPGWGQNSVHWLPFAKIVSSQFRLYLLDLPGFGGTKNLSLDSNVPQYSGFVHSFTVKMGLKKFILSGQSFGGQVAGDFAISYPKKLNRLILIDPAIIRVRGPLVNFKIFISKVLKPITNLIPPLLMNKIMSFYAAEEYTRANKFQRSVLRHILKYNLGPKLHLIKVPTDIIWGSEDHVIPYMGKYLIENIPDATLHVIYAAGHQPHLTHTAKLAAIFNKIISPNESA